MSKWAEIRNDFYETIEECYNIDGWLTGDDNEVGKVIAKVYKDGAKGTIYLDDDARTDEYAQEMIAERQRELEALSGSPESEVVETEMSKEDIIQLLTSRPIDKGGYPKYMLDECIMPTVELLGKRLEYHGIRIAFLKTEK